MTAPLRHEAVRIVEVGARDGLQNIARTVPTAVKLELIEKLLATGLCTVELTSIVSPKHIPQLADCEQLLAHPNIVKLLSQGPGPLRLPVLVPNRKGFEKAIACGVKEIAVFISASDGFSKANIKCTAEEGLQRSVVVTKAATAAGLAVRGYVSCIFACPYDGPTSHAAVRHSVTELLNAGCYEVSLGDTLGVGTPGQTRALLAALCDAGVPSSKLAGHFHDTYGQAVANAWEAYLCGLRVFDSSVAGLGGCPYAPGARGNLATEDLVYMFENAGIDTAVNLEKLVQVGDWISKLLNVQNSSRAGSAVLAKQERRQPLPAGLEKPGLSSSSKRTSWTEVEDTGEVLIFRAGKTMKLVLNRPENGNALTWSMLHKLVKLFEGLQNDLTVSRIILTAKGKFFCTGMDVSKGSSRVAKSDLAATEQYEILTRLFRAIDGVPQVTIAGINGPCYGGGVGLAMACDVRIATSMASVTLSEAKLGLAAATISKYVVREMGIALSREAMLSARPISAHELKDRGIVALVAPSQAELDKITEEYAQKLRQCAPIASAMSKELVKLAWRAAGSQEQDEGVETIFKIMMGSDSESAKGLKSFQRGQRSIDWDNLEMPSIAKL